MITQLEVENFKRITAATITPDGSVILGGNNRQGKTSCLDAIEAALGGKKHCPSEPIQQGKKKARIVLETAELVVTRTFDKDGSKIRVEGKDGAKIPGGPQGMLDSLIGSLSFDPIAFVGMDSKAQAETLRELAGLDFDALNAERAGYFDERTDVNRQGKQARARLDAAPYHEDAPAARVSHADLMDELTRRDDINKANSKTRAALRLNTQALDGAERKIKDVMDEIEEKNKELRDLHGNVELAQSYREEMAADVESSKRDVADLEDENTEEVRKRLLSAEESNRKVDDNHAHAELSADLEALAERTRQLKRSIDMCDDRKANMIIDATYPVDGLTADDDCAMLDGVPFSQASHAEQLQCSVAIGLALNPTLKVLLIRDGSALDANSLEAITAMAKDAGAQLWIERVGHGDECTVIIEDGEVMSK